MKKLFMVLLMFSLQAMAQPVLYDHEFVIESTFYKGQKTLPKLSIGLLTSNLSDSLHITGLYKISGDKGKLGGQAWLRLNDRAWLGWETSSDLNLNADHVAFLGAQFLAFKDISSFLFLSFDLKKEAVGSIGAKIHWGSVSIVGKVAFEDLITLKEFKNCKYTLGVGLEIKPDAIDQLKKSLGIDKLLGG